MSFLENNYIYTSGTVRTAPVFSHETCGEEFFVFELGSKRDSGVVDTFNVLVSNRLIDIEKITAGYKIAVSGQIRSYNKREGDRKRLVLSVFATEISFCQEELSDANNVELVGFVCKEPTYRETPNGREISDLLVAVNRQYGKSDYIPCICWGRNARYASGFSVGEHLHIKGRFQMRTYEKRISETETESRIAYELSVQSVEVIEEEEEKSC